MIRKNKKEESHIKITLLEILIVLFTLVLVVVIFTPVIKDYIARNQLQDTVSELVSITPEIEKCLSEGRLHIGDEKHHCNINYSPSSKIMEENIKDMTGDIINSQSHIVGSFNERSSSILEGVQVILKRENASWNCYIVDRQRKGKITKDYIPQGCQLFK